MSRNPSAITRSALGLALALLVPGLASAIVPSQAPPSLAPVPGAELEVHASTDHFPPGDPEARRPELDRFFDTFSERWDVLWDRRGDRPHLLQGPGIPLLPGSGNDLPGEKPQSVDQVALLVRGLLTDLPELFRLSDSELVLDREASGAFEDHFWTIELQQTYQGIPVEGAKVFFRINHGNVVQLGAERIGEIRGLETTPRLSAEDALARVLRRSGVDAAEVTQIADPALEIFPALLGHEVPGHAYDGAPGLGYRHHLAWELTFRREGDRATYQAVVDARSGRVIRLEDLNRYARVTGGVFPETNLDTEEVRGMPYCTVTDDGGSHVTDADGYFTSGGGTHYVRLDGRYIEISDDCGSIERSTRGDPALGTSSGTDCTTPGVGGAGNTHAARTAFYHLSNVNRLADSYYPSNTWLDGTLTVNTNLAGACNAYWYLGEISLFQSGSYFGTTCGNTGEISDVIVHEWGHGFDDNTGGPAGEEGSGEAVGDTFAFLQNRNSCIGEGFYTDGTTCDNCGSCTGARDMGPFALDGSATIARPVNVEANNGINCDQWSCPRSYGGPMGYEGHCESYIASTANWDLARNLVAAYGTEDGWDEMESLWFGSMQSSQSAYRVTSGGQCNPSASVDGCGSDNWYTVFLSVDDDDGNLANGTPNAGRIWDAYKAHGIACGGTRPDSTDASYTYRLYPFSSSGSSCKRTNVWFNYSVCSNVKEYDVTPGSWIGLYAYGDSCPGCILYHVNFQIQEDYEDGSGWVTVETHDPPDSKGMVYTTSFRPSTGANGKLRIYAPQGFYLRIFEEGVPNGGFETGSSSPGTGVSGAQSAPTITSNSTYVAGRGSYSLGNVGSGTYGGSNSLLWGYNVSVPDFDITASSKLYFDTYGATYSPYSHYHVTVWWTTGGSTTYDNYVCCYNTGIPNGYAQQVFDFPDTAHGRTINKIQISFHKDHSGYLRYKPTIFLDNISLR